MRITPIRKFSIDYRRYLGAAVLFLLFVLILVKCSGPVERAQKPDDTEMEESGESESGTDTEENVLNGEIVKLEDGEIPALIRKVYRAYTDNDAGKLEELYSLLTDHEKSYIAAFADYNEDYQNVECYALMLNEDESFVSACYDLKFYDVDTPAPGLDFFYIQRNEEGNLYVNSAYTTYNFNFMEQELDAGIYAKIQNYHRREEVKELQQRVQARYEELVAGDEHLANLIGGTLRNVITQWQNKITAGTGEDIGQTNPPDTETETEDPSETPDEPQTEETNQGDDTPPETQEPDPAYQVKTRASCNIRARASTSSERIGHANAGDKFTAIGTENGWTKIEFQGGVGYIRDDLIRKVE